MGEIKNTPMPKWKSPRCSGDCWGEIRQADEAYSQLLRRRVEITRDRDAWKQQHENLLSVKETDNKNLSSTISRLEAVRAAAEIIAKRVEGRTPDSQRRFTLVPVADLEMLRAALRTGAGG